MALGYYLGYPIAGYRIDWREPPFDTREYRSTYDAGLAILKRYPEGVCKCEWGRDTLVFGTYWEMMTPGSEASPLAIIVEVYGAP